MKNGEELESIDAIKNENKHSDEKPKEYEVIINDDNKKVEYGNETTLK